MHRRRARRRSATARRNACEVSYPAWVDLATALARGPQKENLESDAEVLALASAGIEAILAGPTAAFPRAFDFSARRRLLDIGGGTGSWSIAAVRAYRHLAATVVEMPIVADVARKRIAATEVAARVAVVTADAMRDPLPQGNDVFLLANILHYWAPEENIALLRRVRNAAEHEAALLRVDFWTDPTHTQPIQEALMAGEFAVHLRHGDVYSLDEIKQWLEPTGWRFVRHVELAGPQSLIVAQAK
jgi:hypothetical protein